MPSIIAVSVFGTGAIHSALSKYCAVSLLIGSIIMTFMSLRFFSSSKYLKPCSSVLVHAMRRVAIGFAPQMTTTFEFSSTTGQLVCCS